ncbi:MAG TPA: nuclear transport factor 2 family protein [Thermomicrobiales bacterium]|nr:nuclear transport factor 2 family protein [Thermomicrobiales bacterium]
MERSAIRSTAILASPKAVVQELFAAIQRGDREAIAASLTDDVEWEVPGPAEIPYAGVFHGRADVLRFFVIFEAAVEFESWAARQFVAEGNTVVVVGDERWRAKSTGRTADNPWVLVVTTRDGKIARFRAYEDTAASRDAFAAG